MNTNMTKTKVNVAASSTEGHYVVGAKQVIDLDAVNDTHLVKGESELVTKNHTSLKMQEDCLITCQTVYNPFSKVFQKSQD